MTNEKSLAKAKKWLQKHSKQVLVGGCLAVPIGLFLVGGYIVTTAAVYAIISTLAFGVLVYKAGTSDNRFVKRAYDLMVDHPLATDAMFTAVVYMMSPGGVIGMLGAGVAAVLASGLLLMMKGKDDDKEASSQAKVVRQELCTNGAESLVPCKEYTAVAANK